MRDRRVRRQKSERPSWQASPVLWWVVRVDPKSFCNAHIQNSGFLQHLAKLLGCRRYDGDEIGLAKPALGAMALQITARATMQHRRVGGSDRRLADLQAKLDDAAPIVIVGVERVARQRHGFGFQIGQTLLEVSR